MIIIYKMCYNMRYSIGTPKTIFQIWELYRFLYQRHVKKGNGAASEAKIGNENGLKSRCSCL